MARGRLLCASLSTSEKRARLHDVAPALAEFAQGLYPLLIAHSDDFGRLQGDTFTVKHAIDPTSPRSLDDFDVAMRALNDVGLVIWYEINGRRFIQITEFDKHQTGLHKRTASRMPDPPAHVSGNLPEIPSEEKRTEEKRTEGSASRTLSAGRQLQELWNEMTTAPLPKCRELTPKREKHALARLRDRPLAEWRTIITRIEASAFCRGESDRGWVATFDWVIGSPDVAVKVLEGKYDRAGAQALAVPRHTPAAAAARQRYAGVKVGAK